MHDTPTLKECLVPGCHENVIAHGLCMFHYIRKRRGKDLTAPRNDGHRGARNTHWNGGTSEYPNHHEMKKVRKVVLAEANYLCPCGAKATDVHHKDCSKSNHRKDNLVAYCRKCHLREHKRLRSLSLTHPRKPAAESFIGYCRGLSSPMEAL